MTYRRTGTIRVDQFIAAPPSRVWRALTDPALHARWWAAGDVAEDVGHEFRLEMLGFGSIPCRVVESRPCERFVYTFDGGWTVAWSTRSPARPPTSNGRAGAAGARPGAPPDRSDRVREPPPRGSAGRRSGRR